MHLLLGQSDSQAREKSRQLSGAGKHMIPVRDNLPDNCVVPALPRLAGEPENSTQSLAAGSLCWARARAGQRQLFEQGSGIACGRCRAYLRQQQGSTPCSDFSPNL